MKPTEYGRKRIAELGLREMFADSVKAQRSAGTQENEIEEIMRWGVAMYLGAISAKVGVPPGFEAARFIEENRTEIDPVVSYAMRILDIE